MTEADRRAELASTAENTAALLIQYDKRLTLLENFNREAVSTIKWIGGGVMALLVALIASGWLK